MNHPTRGLVVLLAVQAVALGVTAPAVVAADRKQDDVCHLASRYLPLTPDAVEGWLRHCPAR